MNLAAFLLAVAAALGGCREVDEFRDQVAPVLEARCVAGVCHGVTPEDKSYELPPGAFVVEVDADGRILDHAQAAQAVLGRANTAEAVELSTVLRKPLGVEWGGIYHQGGTNFTSPQDPGYVALHSWLSAQEDGGENPVGPPPREGETFYVEHVQPALFSAGCADGGTCHHAEASVPFRLASPIPVDERGLLFGQTMSRANYDETRRFLSLGGFPAQSRLIRKALSTAGGGIPHRAPDAAGLSEAAIADILRWAAIERDEAEIRGVPEAQLVFVRGEVGPAPVSQPATFVGGRDLFLKRLDPDAPETNLTAPFHTEPIDVRQPDGAPDGRAIVFAMSKGPADPFRIYELDLETGELQQITRAQQPDADDFVEADLSPVYGSDGNIYFVSNRHRWASEDGVPDLDIYRISSPGDEPERLTFTPGAEIEPALFQVGSLKDYLVFSHQRAVGGSRQTVGFSLPLDFHVDYHIFFGLTAPANVLYQFSELPDGRSLGILTDRTNAWPAGQLALVDRNLGPDFPDAQASGFSDVTLRVLDAESAASGESPAPVYLTPAALPDGRVVFARTTSGLVLGDANANPNFDIYVARVDNTSTCQTPPCPGLADVTLLASGAADEFDPEPIYTWPAEGPKTSALDSAAPTLFSMSDVSVNEAILRELAPGRKSFSDTARYIRFVEGLPTVDDPIARARGVAHLPSRILAEVELPADRSVFVQIPPELPFHTQVLDEDRMSTGTQHDRWIFAWRGQHFRQSAPRRLYNRICSSCHGPRAGGSDDDLPGPDLTTQATITLARYADANPRHPLAPGAVGDATRIVADFQSLSVPLLQACASAACHGESANPTFGNAEQAYAALVPDWVDIQTLSARRSRVIEIATGRDLEATARTAHPELALDPDLQLQLVRWVEVGVPFQTSGDR